MSTEKSSLHKYGICATIAVLLVVAMSLFQVNDPYSLKLALLLPCAVWGIWKQRLRMSLVDAVAVLLWGYDVVLCLTSINIVASISTLKTSTLCLLLYLTLRHTLTMPRCMRLFGRGLWVLAGGTIALTLCSFAIFKESVEAAGFMETYSFRSLFRPIGYPSNAWATLLFLFIGVFAMSYRAKIIGRKMYGCLSVLAWCMLLLSFSRGVFAVGACFAIGLLWAIRMRRARIETAVFILVAAGAIGLTFPQEVRTTLDFHKTASQRQSTQGRIDATEAAKEAFAAHKWFGVGTGNYTLAIDRTQNQDSTQAYTSYAPNIVVQILIEKGWIGIFLHVLVGIGILVYCYRERKRADVRIGGIVLLAVFLKEMTLGTMASTPVTSLLLYVVLAWMQREKEDAANLSAGQYRMKAVWILCGVSYGGIMLSYIQLQQERKQIVLAQTAMQTGNRETAVHTIEQTGNEVPLLINKSLVYMDAFRMGGDRSLLERAAQVLGDAEKRQREDVHIAYLQAELLYLQGSRRDAYEEMKELATCYPKNALYQYKCAEWAYTDSLLTEATAYLSNAIRLMPRILLLSEMQQFKEQSPAAYGRLVSDLLEESPVRESDPAGQARYGFIAYHCGQQEKAKAYLLQAVNEMPQLSTPWLLLGKIHKEEGDITAYEQCMQKYKLLTFGAFSTTGNLPTAYEQLTMNSTHLHQKYAHKFQSWYRVPIYFSYLYK